MAIKELRKTWSDCQLDYVREFIASRETDIADLPTCCVGSTCVVSETNNRYVCGQGKKWKKREEAMEDGCGLTWADLGESKKKGTLLPETVVNAKGSGAPVPVVFDTTKIKAGDKLTVIFDNEPYQVTVVDMSGMGGAPSGTYFFGNLSALGIDSNNEPFNFMCSGGQTMLFFTRPDTADHTIAIYGVVTKYNPIPAEYLPAGGGGGIKTAIFRPKQFDEFMAGDENAYTTSLECVNMTRDEVIQTIVSGQPVDYIVIRYMDSGNGLIVSRPAEPMIEWKPSKNELHIADVGYWFTNGVIDYPAE